MTIIKKRISEANVTDSKELLAENAELKSEIGDIKANIKETKTKILKLEQETEDLNVKMKQIMFEFNKYKEFDCKFKTPKSKL